MSPDELDALRLAILERRASPAAERPAGVWPAAWDELHDRNERIHGRARAELARWTALLRSSDYLRRVCERRKERALVDAVEALERAAEAERDEAKWLRIGCWVARRVDAAAARFARRSRLSTHIDFSPAPSVAEYGESIEATDLKTNEEEGEIKW